MMVNALRIGLAILLVPAIPSRSRLTRPVLAAIGVILLVNTIAFSVLGGALLTRYLLPMYPLILLLCVTIWHRHLRQWWLLAALSAVGFLAGIWINPPYAFAPEDNLTYRDFVVLHQRAVHFIDQRRRGDVRPEHVESAGRAVACRRA